ncbi:MAG: 4-hydroxybenzoate octaprenyltransferase [Fibrobacterota bacterium]|nr:4-hydroxybenzoate octaprenyltransferase [Fibrobacterota bacterium]QQS03964.1 MAG: 4-hydroxybenzoate octaprenyltransferase [Fibrobacterota bacterium]
MNPLAKWFSLVRFSHTFFALPFALAGWIAASATGPSWRTLAGVLVCMVTARNAAMAFNRLIDRKFDAENPRTRMRDIPAGRISPRAAGWFVALNAIVFVGGAWFLNPLCFALSPVALALVLGYSLAKRFTWLCHAWLGAAIGISPIAAGIAASGEFRSVPVWLGGILLTWLFGFDIVYATQDEQYDRTHGLRSVPVLLGRKGALRLAAALHLLTLAGVVGLGVHAHWGIVWWGITVAIGAILAWVHFGRQDDDLAMQGGFFRANVALSFLVLAGVAWQTLVG